MKNEILANLHDPTQLELLYRSDKTAFKQAFNMIGGELGKSELATFWSARLNYTKPDVSWGTTTGRIAILLVCLLAGLVAKLPALLNIDEHFFYPRNTAFVVFPFLSAYFAWKNKLAPAKVAIIAGVMLVAIIFINVLPDSRSSQTLYLSCIHLALVQWCILGFAFTTNTTDQIVKRLDYLKYNGDLIVMTTLILIAGGILSGITIGLFSVIGLNIERFYFNYIVIFALAAAPIVATYLTQTNPQLVGKVSPVIAKIFGPLVLVMLVIYLVAVIYSGKDPYKDRDFLIIFNGLLIGVMAIIFFSVAERSKTTGNQAETFVLLLLSLVTIVVNAIALSAILFRISEWGITPNRAAVLGGNILILINLMLVTARLLRVIAKKSDINAVGRSISIFLPVYFAWAAFVAIAFPFLFHFK